jgi:hypothetical protein
MPQKSKNALGEDDLYDLYQINNDGEATFDEESGNAMTRSDRLNAGRAMSSSSSGGGNAMDIAGSGLMMSGNPYAMAAGAGLMVASGAQKRKDQERQAQWQAKQDRIQRQQAAISNLINVSNSLRNL